MKGIVITTKNTFEVKDFGAPLYKTIGKSVDGYIEIVRPRFLSESYILVVNEEGLIRHLPVNLFGCWVYDTIHHGSPICGNAVLMKEAHTEEGIDIVGLTDDEVKTISDALKIFNYKEISK